MKIQFDFDKCIYCIENKADSWEHIIPESIGGRLQVKVLCEDCNKNLGSKLISKVKEDPSIRLAIRHLKEEIPELFELIENNQLYCATDQNKNPIKLKYKNSRLQVITQKLSNGSLNLDTQSGIENIEQMLKKDRLSDNEIADRINYLHESEPNRKIKLSETLDIAKWSIGPIFPYLKGPLLDERVVVLIAYEFLCLLLGNLIYNDHFDFLRLFIKEGRQHPRLDIGHFMTRNYSPHHKIYPELQENKIIISIILFGWLWYKVSLEGHKLISSDFVCLEDLKNKRTLIAETVAEAKEGIYFDL